MEKEQKKQPIVVEKLDKTPDKIDFSKLDEGDKFQLTTRYLNELCSISKSNLQITADLYILIEFICEKLGIDVKAKKLELAEKIRAQQEQQEKALKEQLEKIGKNSKA